VRSFRHPFGTSMGSKEVLAIGSVVLVADDADVARFHTKALSGAGYHVLWSSSLSGHVCRQPGMAAHSVWIVDVTLPASRGLEVVRWLRSLTPAAEVVVFSRAMDVSTAVELMKRGVSDVLDATAPTLVILEAISTAIARLGLAERRSNPELGRPAAYETAVQPARGSVTARFANLIIRGCGSPTDLKTLAQWARAVGVSYSALAELCRLVGVRPQHARDFVRILRAILHAPRQRCPLEMMLDVSDRRTLTHLLERAHLRRGTPWTEISVADFLRGQKFIEADNAVLTILDDLLAQPNSWGPSSAPRNGLSGVANV
jgi:FixJ family two-component response regulator